jgi:glycosyltransferase involved in cell wall biosynthesis
MTAGPKVSPVHRLWRLLPADARRRALVRITAALASRPDRPPPPPRAPVIIAGYFNASSGLGEAARRLADMFEAAGTPVHRADLTRALHQGDPSVGSVDEERRSRATLPRGPGTLILQVNGPLLPWAMAALGRASVADKHVIGFWNWELPVLPATWRPGFRFLHRVWAPSAFSAAAFRIDRAPTVEVVPYSVPEPSPSALDRAAFGLPQDAFVTLSILDASSSVERKNPAASIHAHRLAFGDRPDRILVIKTYRTEDAGPAWREVADLAAGAPNIRILDRRMSRGDVWALIRAADAFISLHRAEGFGLALAEAMRLGVPVVATGWSGNMDFMTRDNSMLVDYTLVPAHDSAGVYSVRGAHWASPDLAMAADALRRLKDHPETAHAIVSRATVSIAALSPASAGARALAMLGAAV